MSEPHTITLLGGSGFIGTRLCTLLARDGHHMRVLTRHRERSKHLIVLPTLRLIEADIHDEQALLQAAEGSDVLVNLVGILNERGDDGSGFRRAHVDTTRAALGACEQLGIPRYLHMSALNAAAEAPSHYLVSKAEAEALVRVAPVASTVFRPSVVFGPGDSFFNRFAGLLRLSPFVFPLAAAETRFAPVFVDDVARAFIRAMHDRRTRGNTYELCGPEVYTLEELVAYTARLLGIRRYILALPDAMARLQANVLEHFPGKPFSRDNLRSLQLDSVCARGPGLADLGIEPTGIDAVVPDYIHPPRAGGPQAQARKRREAQSAAAAPQRR